MDPVSRGRQASEARDAAAQGILMSGAILIVESDAALAQSLHDGLAGLGYTVELALHGGDGLMLASLSRPDVVILDADLCDRTAIESAEGIACLSDPLLDILAERHIQRDRPLFVS